MTSSGRIWSQLMKAFVCSSNCFSNGWRTFYHDEVTSRRRLSALSSSHSQQPFLSNHCLFLGYDEVKIKCWLKLMTQVIFLLDRVGSSFLEFETLAVDWFVSLTAPMVFQYLHCCELRDAIRVNRACLRTRPFRAEDKDDSLVAISEEDKFEQSAFLAPTERALILTKKNLCGGHKMRHFHPVRVWRTTLQN